MRYFVYNRPDIIAPWVWDRVGGTYNPNGDVAIGLAENGRLIAGVVYENYHPQASVAMHVAAEPGKQWATYKNLKIWFTYPFEQLQVTKVIAPVKESNAVARKFNERLGFTEEARIKDACGADNDLIIYTMTKDRCRFLGD